MLIQKSIVWSDFNLQSEDWELLQIGLVVFFLQVGKGEDKKTDINLEADRYYVL